MLNQDFHAKNEVGAVLVEPFNNSCPGTNANTLACFRRSSLGRVSEKTFADVRRSNIYVYMFIYIIIII